MPLQKHCGRCECRESYLGSDHKPSQVRPSRQRPEQQSVSAVQPVPPGPRQQVPFKQIPVLPPPQHVSPSAQEPPACRQEKQMPLPPTTLQRPLQHSLSAVQGES